MPTVGQTQALAQIEDLSSREGGPEIVSQTYRGDWLEIEVSIPTRGIDATGGIRLRGRERFLIDLPPNFPFDYPRVKTAHKRWAGQPHVQWTSSLCLYLAPDTEWDPRDGMYGFFDRLVSWLESAAAGTLDPDDAPLHPPVAYSATGTPLVIPTQNTPTVGDAPWVGFVATDWPHPRRAELGTWKAIGEPLDGRVAAAVLLTTPLPFEFPNNGRELVDHLLSAGLSREILLGVMGMAVLRNGDEEPLLVVVGAPMRRVSPGGAILQHLAVWQITPPLTTALRIGLEKYSDQPEVARIGNDAQALFEQWLQDASISWCQVKEARQEVTMRRDAKTVASWFRGKRVAILGCGAIGSRAAEMIARAGARSLTVVDNARVTPGVLVRQNFIDPDIGRSKAQAIQDRLLTIAPELVIHAHATDVVSLDGSLLRDQDVIIDATASLRVRVYLERSPEFGRGVPKACLLLNSGADAGLVAFADADHIGGPYDILRKVGLATRRSRSSEWVLSEFWRTEAGAGIQPEPGCSEPTFSGSDADVTTLVGRMVNEIASVLSEPSPGGMAIAFSRLPGRQPSRWSFQHDIELPDPIMGLRVRLSHSALADIRGWIRRSARVNGRDVETGGYLLGEFDDAAQVCWVSEVTGPPPDSQSTSTGFVCGIEGMKDTIEDRLMRSCGAVAFVGHWHTHPGGVARPSEIDHSSMLRLAEIMNPQPRAGLLLIIGGELDTTPEFGASVYPRGETVRQVDLPGVSIPWPPSGQRDIGLAFSGGGFRAAAFHLGCLRALYDRGLLDRVGVISGVSGGALVAGLYTSNSCTFAEFDSQLQGLLRRGLQGKTIRRLLFGPTGPRAFISSVSAIGGAVIAAALTGVSTLLKWIPVLGGALRTGRGNILAYLRRGQTTTTTALSEVLGEWFGERRINATTRDGVDLVLNAVELSTGTAFRFGSAETGDWRFGEAQGDQIRLRDAVAASAAHPAFLPALVMPMVFKRNGREEKRSVTLADGGIYDNLGVSVFDPSRDRSVSYNVFHPNAVISCDAGLGMPDPITPVNLWPSRMMSSMNALFRRATNLNRGKLFDWLESGHLSHLVLAYLGSSDDLLPKSPSLTIRREEVVRFSTNLKGMSERDIEILAARGEQLIRILVTEYAPSM